MYLDIPLLAARQFCKEFPKHGVLTVESISHRYRANIDVGEFTDAQLGVLRSIARDLYMEEGLAPKAKKELKVLLRDLESIINLSEMADKDVIPTTLTFRHLLPVLEAWLKRVSVRGWVVRVRQGLDDGAWIYTGGNYHDVQRTQYGTIPEHWVLTMGRVFRGRVVKDSFSVWRGDVMGAKSFIEACRRLDIAPATQVWVDEYDVQQVRYEKHRALIGEQYLGADALVGVYTDSWRSNREDGEATDLSTKTANLSTGGRATRMVVDDDVAFAEQKRDEVLASEYDESEIPNAQIIRCYSLDHHRALAVPVKAMTEYVYDETVANKLVLPEAVGALVRTLMQAALSGLSSVADVVRNKMGGTAILAHGAPGTGKTLTAEVFSETMKRPLYVVQCSQLGIDVDSIEQNLNRVLRRAEKWKAVLLLDEADVYVMERGANIEQNAIVGVFLRVMEYFDGIMFMTTNRGNLVDDAIRSRCIAEIEYTIPEAGIAREGLWRILITNYGLPLDATAPVALAKKFPLFSGRDMKQLCRLARANAGERKGKPLLALMETLATFKPGKVHG